MTFPLALYRAAMVLALPVLALATLRPKRGGLRGWRERFGIAAADARGVVWVHAASVGEATSARSLIERVLEAGAPVLLTVHTVTGRDVAAGWELSGLYVRLAPWDAGPCVRALVRRWRPSLHVLVESEIWPGRLLTCERAGIPAVLVSARLSERSAAGWARAPGTARRLLGTLEGAAPQDEATGARLVRLGLPEERLWPAESLKAALPPVRRPADWDALRGAFARDRTVIAASTHEGEELFALEAWDRCEGLRLILAPRHPARLPEVLEAIGDRPYSLRSEGLPGPGIYVIDTLGELRSLYGLGAMAFVGGSVAPMGGHTPFEPVAEGCVVVHGPDVSNASEAYAALHAADAALRVKTPGELVEAFGMIAESERLAAIAGRAREALASEAGGTAERVVGLVEGRVSPGSPS